MGSFFSELFSTGGFMPHGYCFAWRPELLWPMVFAQGTVALAYFSIPLALLAFVRRHPGLKYRWVFLLFIAFILACGFTHLISLVNIWYPLYRLDVAVMIGTAGISVATAIMLWPLLPQASAYIDEHKALHQSLLDSNAQLERALDDLRQRNRKLDAHAHRVMTLGRLDTALQSCVLVSETEPPVRNAALSLFPHCSGAMYLMNASRNYLERTIAWGNGRQSPTVLKMQDCWALRRGARVSAKLAHPEEQRCAHIDAELNSGHALCLPMTAQGELLGFLHLCLPDADLLPGALRDSDADETLAGELCDRISVNIANIRLRESLARQSIRDPLSGLFNRRYLEESLERELARAERSRSGIALLMLDVDHFKRFNDQYGHGLGDWVIRAIANTLVDHCRGSDIACRYGGEEFVVVLFDASPAQARKRAEVIRRAISRIKLPPPHGREQGISTSIGVACYPEQGNTEAALVAAADEALYIAKRGGRNRVVLAGDAADTPEPAPAG